VRRPGTLAIYAAFYLVFLYAPVILLPLFAFNDGTIIAFPLSGFTTHWFAELAQTDALIDSVVTSLIIAVVAAVLATLLGLLAARAAARTMFPLKPGIMGLIMLPLILPEIIIAVALLVVLSQLGIALASWTVILGHVLLCTPFAIAILNSAFLALDQSLEEAAQDLGTTKLETFWRVTLPLVMPGIVSSLLISFTISLDEFIIAFFLSGNEPTLPVYLWSQLRFPARIPVVMALGTLLLIASLVLLTTAEYFRRRGAARTGQDDHGGFM
jgi:spermidine/putrescine transport system permease protein